VSRVTDAQISGVVCGVRENLRQPGGWTQGAMESWTGAHCILGEFEGVRGRFPDHVVDEAVVRVQSMIPGRNIPEYNDGLFRTQDQVVRALWGIEYELDERHVLCERECNPAEHGVTGAMGALPEGESVPAGFTGWQWQTGADGRPCLVDVSSPAPSSRPRVSSRHYGYGALGASAVVVALVAPVVAIIAAIVAVVAGVAVVAQRRRVASREACLEWGGPAEVVAEPVAEPVVEPVGVPAPSRGRRRRPELSRPAREMPADIPAVPREVTGPVTRDVPALEEADQPETLHMEPCSAIPTDGAAVERHRDEDPEELEEVEAEPVEVPEPRPQHDDDEDIVDAELVDDDEVVDAVRLPEWAVERVPAIQPARTAWMDKRIRDEWMRGTDVVAPWERVR
jgi:hypothetical protein